MMFARFFAWCALLVIVSPMALANGPVRLGKALVDIEGNDVAVWYPNEFEGKRNSITGEPADGSDLAKQIRPGFIHVIDSRMVALVEHDAEGEMLGQGEGGTLAAQLNVMTADGEAVFAGEHVEGVAFLSEGYLKNPGPDDVRFTATYDGISEQLVINAGDGLYIGSIMAPPIIPAKPGCLCDCVDDGEVVVILALGCPNDDEGGPGDSQDFDGGPPVSLGDCDCEGHEGKEFPYQTNNDGTVDLCVTNNCRAGLVPV